MPAPNLNCTASMAVVVLQYPATNASAICSLAPSVINLLIKCFTNVVDPGLKSCIYPERFSSFALPTLA